MARPLQSLGTVITALHRAAQPQTVIELQAATGLSIVQIRRVLWRGRDTGLIRLGQPPRRDNDWRGYYQYELTPAGYERALELAAFTPTG